MRKPACDNCSGPNKAKRASTVISVRPINAMAAPGKGSRTNPTMTPTKMAKKYQACWAKPAGAGSNARTNATATGTIAFHDQADAFALAGLASPPGPGAGAGIGVLIPPTAFGAGVFIAICPALAGLFLCKTGANLFLASPELAERPPSQTFIF